jgi:WXG100 family type VII secretion target
MLRIRVNYESLRTASAVVSKRSQTIKDISAALSARADALSSTWAGVTEDTWFEQLVSCQNRMAKSPELLDELARDLLASADVIEKAEHNAAQKIAALIDAGA